MDGERNRASSGQVSVSFLKGLLTVGGGGGGVPGVEGEGHDTNPH